MGNAQPNSILPVIAPMGQEQSLPTLETSTSFQQTQPQVVLQQQMQMPPDDASAMGQNIPVVNPLGGAPPRTKVLYYDASSSVSNNGTLSVPDTVFDEHGTPIRLSSLRATEIYMEPPPMQRPTSTTTTSNSPPPADEYVIVATVAVMALLVGALSARKMRSRHFLSSCIENESLEEEVAYDATTTTTTAYDTFGPWKGDLEKFDV